MVANIDANILFVNGYIKCALWLTTDEDGNSVETNEDMLDDDSRRKMVEDADSFYESNEKLINETVINDDSYDFSTAGHDFFLTRNRHGAGYWDRGLEENGEKLTKLAHSEGEAYAYLGDDGKVYYHS